MALDSGTGEVLYRHVRPTDAVKETKESYATPIPHEVDGRTEIVILGADYITGHDPATGDELWRYGSWNPKKVASWRMVTSPVVGAGLLYASCPKNGPIHAVAVNGSETKLAWEMPRGKTTDVPTFAPSPNAAMASHSPTPTGNSATTATPKKMTHAPPFAPRQSAATA